MRRSFARSSTWSACRGERCSASIRTRGWTGWEHRWGSGARRRSMPEAASAAPVRSERLARWLLLALLALSIVQPWLRKEPFDLEVFRLAGERLRLGETLYRASDGAMPFKYSPPVALLFVPLTWVS